MISEYISNIIKQQGRKNNWVAKQSNISYSTFMNKLNNDTFTATELICIARVLDIDLNELKGYYND